MKRQSKRETRSFPPVLGVATLAASTIDRETRTVEMTFYSGSPVFRMPLFDDPYELQFEVSRKAAKLGRLNNGANLIDSHHTYAGISGILGVVEKAWIADGEARATVRFSKRAEVEPVWQDVLDGVVRNVSMGTYILAMEEITEKGAELKRFRATSWEPYEISLVSVPADAGARVLKAKDAEKRPCKISFSASAAAEATNGADAPTEGRTMKIKVRLNATDEIVEIDEKEFDENLHSEDLSEELPDPEVGDEPEVKKTSKRKAGLAADPLAAKRAVDDALERDQKLTAEVKRVAAAYGLDSVWARRQINLATPIEQVLELAAEERAKRAPKIVNDIGFGDDMESTQWRGDRMADALAARASRKEVPEAARQYARSSFVDLAYECLGFRGLNRGLDPRGDRGHIMELALHTTSDFPLLLANSINKIMLPAYQAASPTYREIAVRKDFRDFRPHNFMRPGDFPAPLQVGEHGEYKYGTMGENQELVTLLKFGRIFGISYEAMINDDVGAFNDLATAAARRCVDFENKYFFDTVISVASGLGPTLADTLTVYHATHANVAIAGALDVTRLSDARGKLMTQSSIDGVKMNVTGSILLVSPASYTLAQQLVSPIVPGLVASVNPFSGQLRVLSDANLTGTRFYMLAEPSNMSNYVYGYLGSSAGPRTEVRSGFTTDGVETKVSLEFAVGAVDFRAGITGAGV